VIEMKNQMAAYDSPARGRPQINKRKIIYCCHGDIASLSPPNPGNIFIAAYHKYEALAGLYFLPWH
jgi:hypothetical protein